MVLIIIILFSILLYYIQNIIFGRLWNKNLNINLQFTTPEIFEGEKGELVEVIKNCKPIPLPTLHIKFKTSKSLNFVNEKNCITTDYYYKSDVFSIMPNKQLKRKLKFIGSKRGYYIIDKFDVLTSNIFLLDTFVETYHNSTYLYVYPRTIADKEFQIPINNMIGEYINKSSVYKDLFSFKGQREYQSYDSMSSINWKSSAKCNSLIVNQYNNTSSLSAEIILNTEPTNLNSDILREFSIKIAATICKQLCDSGINFKVTNNSPDIITSELVTTPSSCGLNHYKKILKSLARIDLNSNSIDLTKLLSKKVDANSLVIIISTNIRDEILNTFKNYKQDNNNVFLIYPCLPNTKIKYHEKDIFIWEVEDND